MTIKANSVSETDEVWEAFKRRADIAPLEPEEQRRRYDAHMIKAREMFARLGFPHILD